MNVVVLGLGSNRNFDGFSSVDLLKKAVLHMNRILSESVYSSVYRTKAMYVENQSDFYNMVMLGTLSDEYTPHKLLEYIHRVESLLGRNRAKEIRFGPRSIDIDIEFFGDSEINDSDLQIPHPRLYERAFVLKPLLEILPKCSDVLKGKNLKKIETDFKDLSSDDVKLFIRSAEIFS